MAVFGRQISFLLQDIRRYVIDLIYFKNIFNSINILGHLQMGTPTIRLTIS
jgi:hypothetical protein